MISKLTFREFIIPKNEIDEIRQIVESIIGKLGQNCRGDLQKVERSQFKNFRIQFVIFAKPLVDRSAAKNQFVSILLFVTKDFRPRHDDVK